MGWRVRPGRGRCACDPPVGPGNRLSRVPTQLPCADGQRRRRLPTCHRVRRHGEVRILPSDIADSDSATGDAVSGPGVQRPRGRRPPADAGRHARQGQPRPRQMVGAYRRCAVEHRAGTAAFSRIAVAPVPWTRHRERAGAGRLEPPLHRAVVRKPRSAWFSRAHHRDARLGDTWRPRVRGDRRGAPARVLSARARRSDRSAAVSGAARYATRLLRRCACR